MWAVVFPCFSWEWLSSCIFSSGKLQVVWILVFMTQHWVADTNQFVSQKKQSGQCCKDPRPAIHRHVLPELLLPDKWNDCWPEKLSCMCGDGSVAALQHAGHLHLVFHAGFTPVLESVQSVCRYQILHGQDLRHRMGWELSQHLRVFVWLIEKHKLTNVFCLFSHSSCDCDRSSWFKEIWKRCHSR